MSSSGTASTAAPGAVRHPLPDQLRGLALLGIVLVNMPFLAISGTGGFLPSSTSTWYDQATAFAVVAFAQGKFYLLFSFLFGYSLTLLLRRRTGDGLRRYRRRLVGLAVLGVAHAVFFFIADILFSYALLGVGLLFFVARSNRAALWAAAAAFTAGILLLVDLVLSSRGTPQNGLVGSDPAILDAALRGSFLDAAVGRVEVLPEMFIAFGVLNWFPAFAMFLLGLVAGRLGILANPADRTRLWKGLLVLAATIGLPGGIAAGWLAHGPGPSSPLRDVLSVAIGFGSAPALTAGYVAVIALATRSRVLRLVEPAGRMSLTGYLGESILLTAIFCGWGLGLLGQLGAFHAALVALGVWLALDVFAHLWLRRYTYGPFEWVLRCWSYATIVPLRAVRTDQPTSAPAEQTSGRLAVAPTGADWAAEAVQELYQRLTGYTQDHHARIGVDIVAFGATRQVLLDHIESLTATASDTAGGEDTARSDTAPGVSRHDRVQR